VPLRDAWFCPTPQRHALTILPDPTQTVSHTRTPDDQLPHQRAGGSSLRAHDHLVDEVAR
jgi:hypothetical protein